MPCAAGGIRGTASFDKSCRGRSSEKLRQISGEQEAEHRFEYSSTHEQTAHLSVVVEAVGVQLSRGKLGPEIHLHKARERLHGALREVFESSKTLGFSNGFPAG